MIWKETNLLKVLYSTPDNHVFFIINEITIYQTGFINIFLWWHPSLMIFLLFRVHMLKS